jgi:hypothetical protein
MHEGKGGVYKILVSNFKGSDHLGQPNTVYMEENIKKDTRERGLGAVNWTEMAQDMPNRRIL